MATNDGFGKAIERVLGHEGGYVNHPDDPGGETNWGITKVFAWENGYRGQMLDLTREHAIALYRRGFWDRNFCDVFAFPVAFQFFDCAVHSGSRRATRILQKSVGALDDGIIGPKTFNAVKQADPQTTGERYIALRTAFLKTLPGWATFGRGWQNRMDRNAQYLKDDIHS
jgi:lysozyme family protein